MNPFENKPIPSLFSLSETWASSLWNDASPRWTAREGQDKAYREYVVHPAVRSALENAGRARGLNIIDLGCGDCSFLDDPENRAMIGNEGMYLGVDVSSELIGKACAHHGGERVRFLEGNLDDVSLAEPIRAMGIEWDAALSVFVVQEMTDIGPFFSLLGKILTAGGRVLTVTVHPSFGDWLRAEGRMEVEDRLAPEEAKIPGGYRWAGRYPIVDEPREPFFLPYFHRTIKDYRDAFHRAGLEITEMSGIPDSDTRADLRSRKISPFTPFETNLYWPRIAEEPSALLIAAVKEK
jgi:SAM-dependent methyltransferase